MTVQYDTEIVITERDEAARRVRTTVSGREPRGAGKMNAAVTSQLEPTEAGTVVSLDTELELVGKVAQMGRGMIADVSSKLIGDFVSALDANVLSLPHSNGSTAGSSVGTETNVVVQAAGSD